MACRIWSAACSNIRFSRWLILLSSSLRSSPSWPVSRPYSVSRLREVGGVLGMSSATAPDDWEPSLASEVPPSTPPAPLSPGTAAADGEKYSASPASVSESDTFSSHSSMKNAIMAVVKSA